MKTDELKRLSDELREMPRSLWDQRLLEFCRELVTDEPGGPVAATRPAKDAESRMRRR